MVTMNWLLPETVDPVLNFSLQMLDHILVGLPGSPLRRALIESELGEDLIGAGLENELRQLYYSIGLQGVKPEDFFITNCPNNGENVACRLPAALVGDFYTYAFSASVTGVTWEFSELPDWLKKGTTGANGYIAGKPEECTTDEFLVTAKKGASSVTRKASITITGTVEQCKTN